MHLDVEVCSVVGIHPAVGKELYSAVVDSAVYFDADIVAVVVEEETCSEVDFAAAAEVDSADDFAVAAEEETCSEEEDVHLDIEEELYSAVVDSAVDQDTDFAVAVVDYVDSNLRVVGNSLVFVPSLDDCNV